MWVKMVPIKSKMTMNLLDAGRLFGALWTTRPAPHAAPHIYLRLRLARITSTERPSRTASVDVMEAPVKETSLPVRVRDKGGSALKNITARGRSTPICNPF